MATPRTPKSGNEFNFYINKLNAAFNLDLPNPAVSTPTQRPKEPTLAERCVRLVHFLYYKDVNVQRIIDSFSEWAKAYLSDWVPKPNQEPGTLHSPHSFIHSNTLSAGRHITSEQRASLLDYLWALLRDEEYIVTKGASRIPRDLRATSATSASFGSTTGSGFRSPAAATSRSMTGSEIRSSPGPQIPNKMTSPPKRKSGVEGSEVFVTTPNSPSIPFNRKVSVSDDEFENDLDKLDINLDITSLDLADSSDDDQKQGKTPIKSPKKQRKIEEFMTSSKNVQITHDPFYCEEKPPSDSQSSTKNANLSFSTVATKETLSFGASTVPTSFATSFGNDHLEGMSQCSSTVEVLQREDFNTLLGDADLEVPPPELSLQERKIRDIIDDLEENGPFSKRNKVESAIPLKFRYEAQRVRRSDSVNDLLCELEQRQSELQYDDFWKHLHQGRSSTLEKTKMKVWQMADDQYVDQSGTGDVVTLSGELSWCKQGEKGYFNLALNPFKFERGYRFCRRFGSDRFLEITFPTLVKPPSRYTQSKGQKDILLDAISRWLATSEHHLLGRIWRGFYLDDTKAKSKSSSKKGHQEKGADMPSNTSPESSGMQSKVYLFATDGFDFAPAGPSPGLPPLSQTSRERTKMSVDQLINWHMPLDRNSHQSDCKLFQRLALGLSRTLSTVVLHREEIIFLEDPKPSNPSEKPKPVMNDGCALMSRSLGMEIARLLELRSLPACFQARIAGAKGIWMVDRNDARFKGGDRGFGLQITGSQLKTKPAPPYENGELDDTQLTFEVVQWSRPLSPCPLSIQVLKVLQHGGVTNDHIRNLIQQEMSLFYNEFLDMLKLFNGVACRKWLQKMKRVTDDTPKRQTKRLDTVFPSQYTEQAILLLDSGFLPLKLPYLTELFKVMLKDYMASLEKLKVTVSQSTYAYCIADPYGVLLPDEVHFGFSHEWEHGPVGTELHDIDVLVARLPAHLPTDIQKRRAGYKNELRHFKDVIVFPATGDMPLASLLSGGDYDGDRCWVCWDPIIVDQFTNSPLDSRREQTWEELGLVPCFTPMEKIISTDEFLINTFRFNAKPSKLGSCTNEHETFCYHENNISSERAVKLAWLLSQLVDSKKAGVELTEETWIALRKECMPKKLSPPAYKDPQSKVWDSSNIIDHLLFDVIRVESHRMLQRFKKFCDEIPGYAVDSDLGAIWCKTEDRALDEKQNNKSELYNALQDLKAKFWKAKNEWSENLRRDTPYSRKISMAAQKFQEIQPPCFEHELSVTWRNSEYEWERLRASCAHKICRSDFVWYAAGPVLCEIKAKAQGEYRVVVMDNYRTFRVDRSMAKRVVEQAMRRNAGEESDTEDGDGLFDMDESIFQGLDGIAGDGSSDDDWISLP
ncbi:hypothetical protein AJ79_01872 [Helicocarpus griseus UAMH5409]|uniref:RNA-dependent RNA polymerase n=1 Tax=Helicocarpus griseus UAMH5409 TaxID=1447875 RepID=A0A2B7Y514_9EURO|nr:hypothetical protein AJ79_01872 [Helicocarpus griseus UAMH5409]